MWYIHKLWTTTMRLIAVEDTEENTRLSESFTALQENQAKTYSTFLVLSKNTFLFVLFEPYIVVFSWVPMGRTDIPRYHTDVRTDSPFRYDIEPVTVHRMVLWRHKACKGRRDASVEVYCVIEKWKPPLSYRLYHIPTIVIYPTIVHLMEESLSFESVVQVGRKWGEKRNK